MLSRILWGSLASSRVHELGLFYVHSESLLLHLLPPPLELLFAFIKGVSYDEKIISIEQIPRGASSELTGQYLLNEDKQQGAGHRRLMHPHLDTKLLTVLIIHPHPASGILYCADSPLFYS